MLRNNFTGKFYRVTHHALLRWKERAQIGDDMAESFGRALPFGAQVGASLMLLDGETVFVAVSDESGRCIVTVLSRSQATVNMQNNMYGACSPKVLVPQLVKSEETSAAEDVVADIGEQVEESGPKIIGSVVLPPLKPMPNVDGLTDNNRDRLKKLSDAECEELHKACLDVLRDDSGRITKDQRKRLGSAIFTLQIEISHRRTKKHALLMEQRVKYLKDAARQMLGEEKAVELFILAGTLEKEQNTTSNQLNTTIE